MAGVGGADARRRCERCVVGRDGEGGSVQRKDGDAKGCPRRAASVQDALAANPGTTFRVRTRWHEAARVGARAAERAAVLRPEAAVRT